MKQKLLLDIDEVLCFSGYLELVNEFLNTNYSIDDFTDYYIDEVAIPKNRMQEFNDFINQKNQYDHPIYLPGAVEAIIKLSEYYDIYPCTDCRNPFDLERSGRFFANKFDLLYRSIPQSVIPAKNYIFTGTKSNFKADIQIDDLLLNLDPSISTLILFPSYHNRNISDEELFSKGVIRAGHDWQFGWNEIEKLLIPKLGKVKKLK